jgi:hypothetical protein
MFRPWTDGLPTNLDIKEVKKVLQRHLVIIQWC